MQKVQKKITAANKTFPLGCRLYSDAEKVLQAFRVNHLSVKLAAFPAPLCYH